MNPRPFVRDPYAWEVGGGDAEIERLATLEATAITEREQAERAHIEAHDASNALSSLSSPSLSSEKRSALVATVNRVVSRAVAATTRRLGEARDREAAARGALTTRQRVVELEAKAR